MEILLKSILYISISSYVKLKGRRYRWKIRKVSILTSKCLENQRKQEQPRVLDNCHGAGSPQSSRSHNEEQVVCSWRPPPTPTELNLCIRWAHVSGRLLHPNSQRRCRSWRSYPAAFTLTASEVWPHPPGLRTVSNHPCPHLTPSWRTRTCSPHWKELSVEAALGNWILYCTL